MLPAADFFRKNILNRSQDNFIRGNMPDPNAATGEIPFDRIHEKIPESLELGDIPLRQRMRVHVIVHRRRDQDRLAGRKRETTRQIIRDPRGHFCDEVCRRGRDEQQVRKTLWTHLQKRYPLNLWDDLKIRGEAGTVRESNRMSYEILKKLVQKIAATYYLPVDNDIMENVESWKSSILL